MSEENTVNTKDLEINAGKSRFAEIYMELSKPFPADALSTDSSRGFDLTSVKAQYVVERLNEVLIAGQRGGWEFVGDFEKVDGGIIYHGKLVINDGYRGSSQVAVGFSTIKKHVGDAYKGAMTDSLSKAASKFGIANDVFKGIVTPPSKTPNTKLTSAPKLKTAGKADF